MLKIMPVGWCASDIYIGRVMAGDDDVNVLKIRVSKQFPQSKFGNGQYFN